MNRNRLAPIDGAGGFLLGYGECREVAGMPDSDRSRGYDLRISGLSSRKINLSRLSTMTACFIPVGNIKESEISKSLIPHNCL
jgi:hypothetical protein